MPKGRPQNPELQEKTRQALLSAARQLLLDRSYKSITIRELATLAGTQPAMISYYFDNKLGLFLELLRETASERRQQLDEIANEVLEQPEYAFDILIDRIIEIQLSQPWLFRLIQDDVISSESDLRLRFSEEFPKLMKSGIINLLERLQAQGIVRDDLNLDYFVASFMGLIIFPLLAQPIIRNPLGIDIETIGSTAWKQHVSQLLKKGIQA